jgi:isopenicillin-N epimerase
VLAEYLHTSPLNLVYVPNATFGVNAAARSLNLKAGDEILTSDHEYGACNFAWEHICKKTGAVYVRRHISLPVEDEDDLVESFWQGVTEHTRLIFLSHITSATALRLPIEKICARARQAGILTLIDGAHAPGQIEVNLEKIAADFYTGNCHKWMMAPKSTAFLYVSDAMQDVIEPLVVSWGYGNDEAFSQGSHLVDYFQWTGTHNPCASLSVPAAIKFMQEYNWQNVREKCHELLKEAMQQVCSLSGLPPVYAPDSDLFMQLAIAPLPKLRDPEKFKADLYDQFQVEVPLTEWNGQNFVRISVQGYNTREDLDQLLEGLSHLLPQQ